MAKILRGACFKKWDPFLRTFKFYWAINIVGRLKLYFTGSVRCHEFRLGEVSHTSSNMETILPHNGFTLEHATIGFTDQPTMW
jgi:hypothetical protein